jgi:hypothetical protein
MAFYEHITTFDGLPVVAYTPQAYPSGAEVSAASVAWRVETDYDGGEALFAERWSGLLASEWAGQIRALVIGEWGESFDNVAPIDALVEAAGVLVGLRALFLGEMTSEENEISWIVQDDIGPVLEAYPSLEVLRVRGGNGLELATVSHQNLRELAFESGGLPGPIVRTIGACDFPALRHLELWLGTERYGGNATVDDLAQVLSGVRLPSLSHLGLRDAEIADLIAGALAGAPVVARLRSLDLSLGMLSDTGAAALLSGQPLTHLDRLDLHHHYLSEEMMERLRDELELGAGVELDISDANGANTDMDNRYIAVSE